MIHPALVQLYSNSPHKPKEIWISDVVYCLRRAFFSYLLPLQKQFNDAQLAGIFIHRLIQDQLSKEGFEIEKRVEYDLGEGWKLVGRIDAWCDDTVIEIKTVKGQIQEIPPYWIDQANVYAYLSETPKLKLIVVDKTTGHFEEYIYDVDEDRAIDVIKKAEHVKDCIINRTLPDGRMDWCKKYCGYSVICFNILKEKTE